MVVVRIPKGGPRRGEAFFSNRKRKDNLSTPEGGKRT